MHDEQQGQFVQISTTTIIIILTGLFLFLKLRAKRRSNPRKSLTDTKDWVVPSDRIIIALEIENLFVEYSRRKKTDFSQLHISQGLKSFIERLFGFGYYYRLMYTPSKIKDFLTGLRAIPDTELFLYTSLDRTFIEEIIKKVALEKFFPEENRRYNQQLSGDALKHASEVDTNTRRVMIVTATHDDHSREDSKYFLVLHNRRNRWQNFLRDSLQTLKIFFGNLQSIDDLHEHLSELKIHVESESEFE